MIQRNKSNIHTDSLRVETGRDGSKCGNYDILVVFLCVNPTLSAPDRKLSA